MKPVAYAVSKSAVLNLTRYLATYWAKAGVRVNTLTLAGVWNEQPAEFLDAYTARVPMGGCWTRERRSSGRLPRLGRVVVRHRRERRRRRRLVRLVILRDILNLVGGKTAQPASGEWLDKLRPGDGSFLAGSPARG